MGELCFMSIYTLNEGAPEESSCSPKMDVWSHPKFIGSTLDFITGDLQIPISNLDLPVGLHLPVQSRKKNIGF